MFFLLRSSLCIGLVVAALPDRVPTGAEPIAASIGAGAAEFCHLAPERCLAVLGAGLQAVAPGTVRAGRPSRDTLSAADRRLAWAGPVAGR